MGGPHPPRPGQYASLQPTATGTEPSRGGGSVVLERRAQSTQPHLPSEVAAEVVGPVDERSDQRDLVCPVDDDRAARTSLLERVNERGALPGLREAAAQLEPVAPRHLDGACRRLDAHPV